MTESIDSAKVLRHTDRWRAVMPAVTVSPKFQVVIPSEIRKEMNITAGQQVQMMIYKGMIVLVPVRPMEEMRGFVEGIDTTIARDPDRI